MSARQEPLVHSLLKHLGNPAKLFEYLDYGWDRPIRATVELRGPFNEFPRLPYQLGAILLRAPELVRELVRSL